MCSCDAMHNRKCQSVVISITACSRARAAALRLACTCTALLGHEPGTQHTSRCAADSARPRIRGVPCPYIYMQDTSTLYKH